MIRIVWKSTLEAMREDIADLEIELNAYRKALQMAQDENQRLFDHHNKRLQKPKKDKNGVLRDKYGRFAKK